MARATSAPFSAIVCFAANLYLGAYKLGDKMDAAACKFIDPGERTFASPHE